ncbi:MAG TPA: hypothetical protein PKB14_21955 [Rubrivivax sp.]|nr:hypothetical protein [Rubrivivax sp.]
MARYCCGAAARRREAGAACATTRWTAERGLVSLAALLVPVPVFDAKAAKRLGMELLR